MRFEKQGRDALAGGSSEVLPGVFPNRRRHGVLGGGWLCVVLTLAVVGAGRAQVTLTRILEGDIALDTGPSMGCAWGDFDGDGYPDLFVADAGNTTNRLYRNNGDGSFTRILAGAVVGERVDSDAGVWGDYDNDGDLDLFVANFNPPRDCFYRNEGGVEFTKVTEGAWVSDVGYGVGAAWADYDGDGWLDLFVANSGGQSNYLYRNNGDGTMVRIVAGRIVSSGGNSHGCAWSDYDGDGDVDLLVTGGNGQNGQQFLNNGDGTFTRILAGHLVTSGGEDMGISCADYDNDGDPDVLVTGFGRSNRLYANDGPAGFRLVVDSGLTNAQSATGAWGDYDNDGDLDLFVANAYGRDNDLYRNNGDGTFARVTEGSVVHDGGRSYGAAWADYDNDGDLDLYVANGFEPTGSPPPEAGFLYRNDGGTNHWLMLRLVGVVSNRSAVGARLRVLATIDGRSYWQGREITVGSGYCSQDDLRAHFGLGDATTVRKVVVDWPSGISQVLTEVAVNQVLTVVEDPIPLVALSFSEGGGPEARNVGSLSGTAAIHKQGGATVHSGKVPTGPCAPPNNLASIDLSAGSGSGPPPTITIAGPPGSLPAFTLCGWLNARDRSAGVTGNRIVSALASLEGPGLELVQRNDGSLALGINQAAGNSPIRSSSGRVPEALDLAPGNWVFFAVTYDGTLSRGQFFFGTAEELVQPDAEPMDGQDGVVAECGPFTVGNPWPTSDPIPWGESSFRGLLDEIEIYDRVLSLEELQAVQTAPASRLACEPTLMIRQEGTDAVIEWESARWRQAQRCTAFRSGASAWQNLPDGAHEVDGFRHRLRQAMSASATQMFWRLQ